MAPPSEDAIRAALARVLNSHEFRASKRSQEFLRYVVERTLGGEAGRLKERNIATDVFGRPADYDPSDDATVRVKAGEVRKRLGLYYALEGSRDPVRIDLPGGTYVPEFALLDSGTSAEFVSDAGGASPRLKPADRRQPVRLWIAGTAGLVVVVAAAAAMLAWRGGERSSPLHQFWEQVGSNSVPASICAAYVPVYSLGDRRPEERTPPKAGDFLLLSDQFVGGGDLLAVSKVSSMLTRMRRPYEVRLGNSVSFHDLRASPAILVGYSYTRWREISSQMRYFIDATKSPIGITDNGKLTSWTLPNLPPNRQTNEDYAIVSRVFHPDTHMLLVEIAGVTQYGTAAAADFVTSNDLIADAVKGAPPNWHRGNLQFVLHTKVISGEATTPTVVATYFW